MVKGIAGSVFAHCVHIKLMNSYIKSPSQNVALGKFADSHHRIALVQKKTTAISVGLKFIWFLIILLFIQKPLAVNMFVYMQCAHSFFLFT